MDDGLVMACVGRFRWLSEGVVARMVARKGGQRGRHINCIRLREVAVY